MSKSTNEVRLARAKRVGDFFVKNGTEFVKCTPEEQLEFRKDYIAMLEDGDFYSAERLSPWDSEYTFHQAELHDDYDREFLQDNITNVNDVFDRMFREDNCVCTACQRRRGELVDDAVLEAREEFGEPKGNTLKLVFLDDAKVEAENIVKESNNIVTASRTLEIEKLMPIILSVGEFFEKYGEYAEKATDIEKAEFKTNYKTLLEAGVFYCIEGEEEQGDTLVTEWGCVDAITEGDDAMEFCQYQLDNFEQMIEEQFSPRKEVTFADFLGNMIGRMA